MADKAPAWGGITGLLLKPASKGDTANLLAVPEAGGKVSQLLDTTTDMLKLDRPPCLLCFAHRQQVAGATRREPIWATAPKPRPY